MKPLLIALFLLLPVNLSVPLPSTGNWQSEAQYFKCISGMAYHGVMIAYIKGESMWFERDGKRCKF